MILFKHYPANSNLGGFGEYYNRDNGYNTFVNGTISESGNTFTLDGFPIGSEFIVNASRIGRIPKIQSLSGATKQTLYESSTASAPCIYKLTTTSSSVVITFNTSDAKPQWLNIVRIK